MFRKSYTIMLVIVLIIGAIMSFFGFTPAGKTLGDFLIAGTFPDNVYPLYVDMDERNLNRFDTQVFCGRDVYEPERLLNTSVNTGAVISYNYSNIEVLKNNYENNEIYAYLTTACLINSKNIKDSLNIKEFENKESKDYLEVDLERILLAFLNGETWEEIGFNSNKEIELYLPAKDSPFYPVIVAELYAVLAEDSSVSLERKKELDVLVEGILDKAFTGEYPEKAGENQIFLMCEQSWEFYERSDRNRTASVYPSKNIYIPVYIFWSNPEFTKVVNNHLNDASDNILVSRFGCRNIYNKNYSSTAYRDSEHKWNPYSPDSLNIISIEEIWSSINE